LVIELTFGKTGLLFSATNERLFFLSANLLHIFEKAMRFYFILAAQFKKALFTDDYQFIPT
jgi:hypothetical protein